MSLLAPVAAFAYRQRIGLLVLFLALFAFAAFYGRGTAADLVGGGFEDPSSESSRADVKLDERFGLGTPDVVVAYSHDTLKVSDPAFEQLLAPGLSALRAVKGVSRVGSPFGPTPDALVSNDGHTVVTTIRLSGNSRAVQASYKALEPLLRVPGLKSLLGGAIPGARQAQEAAESDLARAELITLPLVALLLVVFFRGLVVASLPLLIGGFSVAAALACVRVLTHFTDVSVFALNIVTFVGLGVAIDYSLFMTSRFRDELAAGVSVERAIDHTLQTAGRTIGYSGGAVAVSLLALTAFPLMLLRSVAIAGSLVVIMSLIGTLVFLPALLAVLGPRVEWLSFGKKHAVEEAPKFWHKVATAVMRKPVLFTVVVTGLLVVLGLPFLHIKPSVSGASVLPEEAEARKVAELVDSPGFPQHSSAPVEIVASSDADALSLPSLRTLGSYVQKIQKIPHVARVDAVVYGNASRTPEQLVDALRGPYATAMRSRLSALVNGKDSALRVALDVPPTSDEATAVVKAIRATHVPGLQTLATSPAARVLDLQHSLTGRMAYALSIICLSTFIVLFLAFGSVIMPIKAILMNVLSLTASFGALVFIFQEGRFESLLRFKSPGSIELTIPVMMFAVVFGLAMDYELFLLSRIREEYDRHKDTHRSVTIGLERTAQIITRAALLLVAVMVGFASADMLLVKELGVGMAIAVIVDATIVRALLVPATMQLLGHYNWWAPGPLARWWQRAHLGIDERSPEELDAASVPVAPAERTSVLPSH
ncbi:MAG: drug exporter of the superfamily-like protein [Myxococcaceae bacterium]|nr:drug exporter of the superfamily-like protein [Myxococcaceae bacterium]